MTSCHDLTNVTGNCTNPHLMTQGDGEPLSEETISWILATLPIGALIGCSMTLFLLRTIGRKYTIIISGVLFLVSFLCIGKVYS